MEQLILNIKDRSKLTFLMQLINQLDFIYGIKIQKCRSFKITLWL